MTDRIHERLDAIHSISAKRLGYSPEEDAAHELAAGWMREAGLEVSRDDAGNLFGRRGEGRVWTGSHLDSVPDGGRFDGVLGVVGAIEAAERLPDASFTVVVFRAEEEGPVGSTRVRDLPAAFVELHIEQGPVLEWLEAPLGVVTAIAGQARGTVLFEGRADHVGTTPMDQRTDALVAAAGFVIHVRDCASGDARATVGRIDVAPNISNVVPARVAVTVDARAPTREQLDELVAAIGFEPSVRVRPTAMSGAPFEAVRAVLPDAPLLSSGAGHDAMVLADAGVPTAMIFVRSLNGGASHSSLEHSSPEDVAAGVDALIAALARLTQTA